MVALAVAAMMAPIALGAAGGRRGVGSGGDDCGSDANYSIHVEATAVYMAYA